MWYFRNMKNWLCGIKPVYNKKIIELCLKLHVERFLFKQEILKYFEMTWKVSFDFCRAMILSRLCCSWWRPWLSWRKETPSWECTTGVRNRQGRSSCGLKLWWRRPQESKSSTISSTVKFAHVHCVLPHRMHSLCMLGWKVWQFNYFDATNKFYFNI